MSCSKFNVDPEIVDAEYKVDHKKNWPEEESRCDREDLERLKKINIFLGLGDEIVEALSNAMIGEADSYYDWCIDGNRDAEKISSNTDHTYAVLHMLLEKLNEL